MWLWLNIPSLGNAAPPGLRAGPDDRRRGLAGQLGRFLAIGVASTVAYALLYLLLRTAMAAQAANAISLLVTAVANTAANRRVTFGIRGRAHAARHQVRGLIAFGIGLGLTSGALIALHTAVGRPGRGGRGDRARRGQPGRDHRPVRALPALGLPRPPGPLARPGRQRAAGCRKPGGRLGPARRQPGR